MLVDMMTGQTIMHVSYVSEYRKWMARMTPAEVADIQAALNAKIDGTEIQTAGWMPGANWTGTAFQPIYEKATRHNTEIAARCFA